MPPVLILDGAKAKAADRSCARGSPSPGSPVNPSASSAAPGRRLRRRCDRGGGGPGCHLPIDFKVEEVEEGRWRVMIS